MNPFQKFFIVDGQRVTLADFLDANCSDFDACEWAESAKPGESFPAFVQCQCVSGLDHFEVVESHAADLSTGGTMVNATVCFENMRGTDGGDHMHMDAAYCLDATSDIPAGATLYAFDMPMAMVALRD